MKNRASIIVATAAIALLAAAAGAVVGGIMVRQWAEKKARETKTEFEIQKTDPELIEAIQGLKEQAQSMQREIEAVRSDGEDIYARIEALAADTATTETLRETLPLPYVNKVDKFFQSSAPKTLLSRKIYKNPNITFARPMFVTHDIISVPYHVSDNYHCLLVKITILDYYDLQFDVIWDSLEGG